MARKSRLEKNLEELSVFPWWVLLLSAFIAYIGIRFGLPLIKLEDRIAGPFFNGLTNGLAGLAWFPALVLVVAALGSFVKARNGRRLLDNQSGIKSIRNEGWQEFEKLVGEAYRRQGYAVKETGGNGPDGGVDLILRNQSETVLVQCKHWRKQSIGVKIVRELLGVVTADSATRGIVVASGTYTKDAINFARKNNIELVDGETLVSMVTSVQKTAQKPKRSARQSMRVIEDTSNSDVPECPSCGGDMVMRLAKRGANAGNHFLGCTGFPKCRGTRQAA